MKTTTALVGVGAAAVAGVALYFAFRKPEEEKPAAATPTTPSKLGPGSTPGGGAGSGSSGRGDTTHSIVDHHSIDQIVDIIRDGSRGMKIPGQTTQTQQPITQTLDPTSADNQWNKAKEAGL